MSVYLAVPVGWLRTRRTAMVCLLSMSCLALVAGAATGVAHAQDSTREARLVFEVPAGRLSDALARFSRQAGITLSFEPRLVEQGHVPALNGEYTVEEALARLLSGQGIQWVRVRQGAYALRADTSAALSDTTLAPVRVGGNVIPRQSVFAEPGSIAVITREDIDRLPPRNTADVFAGLPGVMTSNDRQNPGVRINIRGLEGMGRVNATIDGARQNYQQSGHTGGSSVYVDTELLSGVDVRMGPSATLGGAGVIGGTVNFRTLMAEDVLLPDRHHGVRINAATGTNRYDFSGSVAAALRESVQESRGELVAAIAGKQVGDYKSGRRGGGGLQASQGDQRELTFSRQAQASGLLKASWQATPHQRVSLGYVGFQADYTDNDTDDEYDFSFRNRNDIRVDTLTLSHAWRPDNTVWHLDSSLWYTRTVNDQFREDRGNMGYGTFDVHYETNTLGGSLDNTSTLFSGETLSASLNYGVEAFYDWTRPDAVAHAGGDPAWFSDATPEGQRYVASAFSQYGLFIGDTLEMGVGLRYDWYRLTGDGNVYTGPHESGNFYQPFALDRRADRLAPSLRIAYAPWPSTQFYLLYAEGFRPPMITETLMMGSHPGALSFPYLPNPGLKEERARNWEAGVNLNFASVLREGDVLRGKLAAFDNRVHDYVLGAMIMMPTEIQPQGIKFSFVNIENPVRFYGLEFQTDYETRHFFSNINLTWTRADLGEGRYDPLPFGTVVLNPDTGNLGGGDGLMLGSTPPELRYALSVGARSADQRLEAGVRVQFVGDRDDLSGGMADLMMNTSLSKNYRLYDAWASWSPTPRLQLRLAGQNLTDEKYIEALSSAGYIAPGRTALLSATARF